MELFLLRETYLFIYIFVSFKNYSFYLFLLFDLVVIFFLLFNFLFFLKKIYKYNNNKNKNLQTRVNVPAIYNINEFERYKLALLLVKLLRMLIFTDLSYYKLSISNY